LIRAPGASFEPAGTSDLERGKTTLQSGRRPTGSRRRNCETCVVNGEFEKRA